MDKLSVAPEASGLGGWGVPPRLRALLEGVGKLVQRVYDHQKGEFPAQPQAPVEFRNLQEGGVDVLPTLPGVQKLTAPAEFRYLV